MSKAKKGERAKAFRAQVDEALKGYGFKQHTWAAAPSRLVLVVNGSLREVPMHAGMSRQRLAFELGRFAGWSEMLRAA
jgi:hypothetical protein